MVGLEQSPNWITLQQLCDDNVKYFSSYDNTLSLKMKEALLASLEHLKKLPRYYDKISKVAPLFDFDAETPGNGYRSFIGLVDKCILNFVDVNKQVINGRSSFFFRQSHYTKEIEAYSQLTASLFSCLQHLETLFDWNEGKEEYSLFTDHTPQELLDKAETINQYCFYGRPLGFQFCDSMRRILLKLSTVMASYSEIYYNDGPLTKRLKNFIKYVMSPEARAKRVCNISQWAEIEFCQAFWTLSEGDFIMYYTSLTTPFVKVNHLFHIPPEELILESTDGSSVEVPIPMSHIGMKPIQVRFLSDIRRMNKTNSESKDETSMNQSKSLIIHCHGGGFVAQSSRSHEIYLRKWTIDLQIPILSIDYSLAPEAPFPRALEEVVYVYGWVLKNGKTLLGTTLEKIILVGDSAGANLCAAATLRCMELNLRLPDGIFMAYSPMWVEFVPSPSRLLCLTDPLLPFGFLIRCLKAYTTVESKKTSPAKKLSDRGKSLTDEFLFEVPRDPLLSPYLASDQKLTKMPPFKILTMELDPCLDDCIMFGKKLKGLGVPVTLDIVSGLSHGFLNFIGLSKEAMDGANLCAKRIKELVDD